jgi:hypothetical protein
LQGAKNVNKKNQSALRRTGILAVLMIIVITGGVLSSGLFNINTLLVIQTDNPDASAFEATPVQAFQFFFWVFFVIGNVAVVGGVLALVFYVLNRMLTQERSTPTTTTNSPATTETAE